MPWNWELADWPNFKYNPQLILADEKQFLLTIGGAAAYLKTIQAADYRHFIVEILSTEGIESSKIEGEYLDRENLQSSIKKHFGLSIPAKRAQGKELGMGELLCSVYESYNLPLTHQMLWDWHALLFRGDTSIERGQYRIHTEPMQIVSNRYGDQKVFFEAPPSEKIFDEMEKFIRWFNTPYTGPMLCRSAIAHVYFESIHPFEDGNGRVGRILVEKILSQGIQQPILLAVSKVLEQRKKEYYAELEKCNRSLVVDDWVEFFVSCVLQAQEESMRLLHFLIKKSKILSQFAGQLNERQEKALLRMFAEGPDGFQGGLSAEKYISITKASKATATRDLSDLVEKRVLIRTGTLRHTRYWLESQGIKE